ncbi:MAG: S8 family serine peptidase, partial [Acidobacteriota bacterium]|nr:S8 family serine peptidase [Acidobacteriota bacterium]
FDEVTCGSCDRFAFTEESKNAYEASFQSNSWGTGSGVDYGVDSWEMDELIWRLDMAIFQAMNNNGNLGNPQDAAVIAWAKNAVSVGGVHHENTLDPADDWWCDHDCATLHATSAACNADPNCDWNSGQCEDDYICGTVGPAADGRVKPDLSYFIDDIHTTTWNNTYTTAFTGTSAATPEVAGALGLILEMWADTATGTNPWGRAPMGATVFERQPHAATMKALLINAARSWEFAGSADDLTRMHQGWGRPDLEAAFERAPGSLVIDEELALVQDEVWSWKLDVAPGVDEIRATLVWLDPPKALAAAGRELINDLDLELVSPEDAMGEVGVYCGNAGLLEGMGSIVLWSGLPEQAPDCDDPGLDPSRDAVNNVENVFVREESPGAGIASGTWTVRVKAHEVLTDGNPDDDCRGVDLDDPNADLLCAAQGCEWDEANEVCGDPEWDVVFGLVVTGGARLGPAAASALRVGKNGGGTLRLEWQPDCGGTATHGVYRGDLSAGYESIAPEPDRCEVGGNGTTIPEGPGAADFFVVVPNDGVIEGGYGADRTPAPSGCFPTPPSPCK